jgi:HdeA/HdeB family
MTSRIKTAWRDEPVDPRRSKCKESEMGEPSTKLWTLAIMLAGVLATGSAQAQSQADRTIEQFKCKDVMREPDQNRAVAIAFLHGYLLGKSGDSKFNVEVLEKQTDAFIEQCLDSPQTKAEDVMLKLKN